MKRSVDKNKNFGGDAFPTQVSGFNGPIDRPGMSMRQYYKGCVIQGLAASGAFQFAHIIGQTSGKEASLEEVRKISSLVEQMADILVTADKIHEENNG